MRSNAFFLILRYLKYQRVYADALRSVEGSDTEAMPQNRMYYR